MHRLDGALASRMSRLAVDNIEREYPNAPGHLIRSADDLRRPRELHPAFFGSYDWHSSVHQHWLLVRLLRLDALDLDEAASARAALDGSLTGEKLAIEAAYLADRPSFERTYGWAWLLELAAELAALGGPDGERWLDALQPASAAVRANWLAFLDLGGYPIRAGIHANSAFGLLLGLDYARVTRDVPLASALERRARAWFEGDAAYAAALEPGGDDFLSGALVEAVLMGDVLGARFSPWLDAFLPGIRDGEPATLFVPAAVADRADGKTVHLDGLNLSRAWCWRTIAARVDDARIAASAGAAAEAHLDAAFPHLFSGEYVADHWTTTFALLALTRLREP